MMVIIMKNITLDKFKSVPPDIFKIKGKKYRSGNSNSE